MCVSSSATRIVFSLIFSSLLHLRCCGGGRLDHARVELEPEATALARLAFHIEPSAMDGLNDVFHERQSEARAVAHPFGGLGPVELIEDKGEVLLRDPYAII